MISLSRVAQLVGSDVGKARSNQQMFVEHLAGSFQGRKEYEPLLRFRSENIYGVRDRTKHCLCAKISKSAPPILEEFSIY